MLRVVYLLLFQDFQTSIRVVISSDKHLGSHRGFVAVVLNLKGVGRGEVFAKNKRAYLEKLACQQHFFPDHFDIN